MRKPAKTSSTWTRWHQFLSLLATTLTCVFGVGVAEELDLREESREHADHQVSASEELIGPKRLAPKSLGAGSSADRLAAVACAAGLERLAEPGPPAARETSPLPVHVGCLHGPPVYRVAPSHSPPIV